MSIPPKSITSDFEKAFINGCIKVFPKTTIYLCFFHFKQSMWRKISELGLSPLYLSNGHIRRLLKLPQVLAFVPPEDVIHLFDKLKLDIAEEDEHIKECYVFGNL